MKRCAWLVTVLLAAWFPMTPGQGQEPAGETWELTDATGDVRPSTASLFDEDLTGGAGPGLPSSAATDHLDIHRVFLEGENETTLTFGLEMGDVGPLVDGVDIDVTAPAYLIHFRLTGALAGAYRLEWGYGFGCLLCSRSVDFYSVCSDDEFSYDCRGQNGVEVDESAGVARFRVDRDLFSYLADGASGKIHAGDRLEGVWAESRDDALADRAPDADEAPDAFTFRHGTANDGLALLLEDEREDADEGGRPFVPASRTRWLGATAGEATTHRLLVWNRLSSKQVVNLAYELDGDAAAWNVTVPPAVVVAAGDAVPVTMTVTVPSTVAHREGVWMKVRATAAGAPGEIGLFPARLIASLSPSPTQNVLYFHTSEERFPFWGVDELDQATDPATGEFNRYSWPALNVLQSDDSYEEVPWSVGCLGRSYPQYVGMDTPLASDLLFDVKGGLVLDLSLRATRAADFTVTAYVFAGEELVAKGSTRSAIGTADTPVSLTMPVALRSGRINATDGSVYAALEIEEESAAPTGVPFFYFCGGGFGPVETLVLLPGGSTLTMPLLDLPPEAVTTSSGERRLSLSLRPGKGSLEYVNPGETVAFPLRITNEGLHPESARLALNVSGGAWRAELRPGSRVDIAPGESANATLLVHASAAAQEGERLTVQVSVASKVEPGVLSTLNLVAVATRGIDLEDEADAAPAVKGKKAKDSPAPSPLMALGAALLIYRRRRRDG